jgi:hypothetical protein
MLRLFLLFQLVCLLAVSHRTQGEGVLGNILNGASPEEGGGDRTQEESVLENILQWVAFN